MSLDHKHSPADYEFPRLYVEGEESSEYLIPDRERGMYTLRRGGKPPSGGWMGLKPYEWGWARIFDPVEARVTRDFAVVLPWDAYAALYAPSGVEVRLVEASGVHVNLVAREGDDVEERSILAYVVTGKGETKTVRAEVKGVIIYIAWDPSSSVERYAYLIASPEEIEELEPDEEALRLLGSH